MLKCCFVSNVTRVRCSTLVHHCTTTTAPGHQPVPDEAHTPGLMALDARWQKTRAAATTGATRPSSSPAAPQGAIQMS